MAKASRPIISIPSPPAACAPPNFNDGRRQIGAFYLPGDVFGLEAGAEHTFSAEALAPTTVRIVKRAVLALRAAGDSEMASQLLNLTVAELQRVQSRVLLLIKSAQERVVGFLLEMASRVKSVSEIDLPMCRQDIADYLSLTIETVSRTLTQLEAAAAIALPTSRRIVCESAGVGSHQTADSEYTQKS